MHKIRGIVHGTTVWDFDELSERWSKGPLGVIQSYHLYGKPTTNWNLIEVIVSVSTTWQGCPYILLDKIRIIIIIIVLSRSLRSIVLFFFPHLMIIVWNVKQTSSTVLIVPRLLTDIPGLLAESVMEFLLRWWAHLFSSHGHYGLLLLLWLLRCLLLYDYLLLNDWLTILIILVLIHYVAARMKILLTLITPGALNSETLIVCWREPACLSDSSEVIICKTKCPIFEGRLIIILPWIRLYTTTLLELRLRDISLCFSALTLVILPADLRTHDSR